ncbi:MAG: response regulator transcription factor [Planctomycetes bacterium]|nr:response regulator transcription factor [Planctomycetota bacterium]
MHVLVIEDQERIVAFLERGLAEAGFTVTVCRDGDDGYHVARTGSFDAIVLDIMLPGRDGLSILRNLRQAKHAVPVLILSARGELPERLEGLDLGADDYLTKPFYIEELVARLHAVTRRLSREQLSSRALDDLHMNLITRRVERAGREIEFTVREFALLEYLLRSPGRVLTRTQILEQVWGYDFDPGTNLVDVYIRRIRKKIDDDGTLIETVRGVGYRAREVGA